ncbi:MAG: methanogenesis marker 6 protein [Methanomicrobiales archaeon]|nr:methanogenesis marker 6 protein [Methanomicrobiales archaeon]
MKEYVPAYAGTVTKYVFVESPDVTPQQLAIRAYEVSEGVMIKETCFGLQITGTEAEVARVIAEIRKMDPSRIFVKDRGFPPGDPRRCRANLGGARPGYYGHEFETGLLRYISYGLDRCAREGAAAPPPETCPPARRLDVRRLQQIIEAEER